MIEMALGKMRAVFFFRIDVMAAKGMIRVVEVPNRVARKQTKFGVMYILPWRRTASSRAQEAWWMRTSPGPRPNTVATEVEEGAAWSDEDDGEEEEDDPWSSRRPYSR